MVSRSFLLEQGVHLASSALSLLQLGAQAAAPPSALLVQALWLGVLSLLVARFATRALAYKRAGRPSEQPLSAAPKRA